MLPRRDGTLSPPHSLRRRQQQSHYSEAGPPDLSRFPFGHPNQMLDLSICHHPSQAFNNRFSILATPPPSLPKPAILPHDLPNASTRRTRHSRGTKEAKKRRDMRRNRRKLAAQLLDQQLSQAFDDTLTKASLPVPAPLPKPRSLPALPASASAQPTAGIPLPQSAHLPPTPPELSLPDFSAFDLSAFPHFSISATMPPPLRTPSPFRTLPKWCPKIPSLTLGDVWRDCLPTFHDLSSLPEPSESQSLKRVTMREPSDYFQLRRPIGTGYGRDQSRFFPPRKSLTLPQSRSAIHKRAKVKLPPPVACRLHQSDKSVDATLPMSKSIIAQAAIETLARSEVSGHSTTPAGDRIWQFGLTSSSCEDKETEDVPRFAPDPAEQVLDDTTATTLWRKFESNATNTDISSLLDLYKGNILPNLGHPQPRQDSSDLPPPYHQATQALYELEAGGVGLPYVHANSLIGYSDTTDATEIFTGYQTPQTLVDSAVGLPIVLSNEENEMVGLNELVVDHDIMAPFEAKLAAAVPLPPSVPITPLPTPPSQSFSDIAAILPVDCIAEAEYEHSDAHYHSEQALFQQTPASLAQCTESFIDDPDFGSINIADFLKLGHAKQCWCGHCIDESYNAPRDEARASVTSPNALADGGLTDESDYDYDLSMLIHPSESEPDTEPDNADLFDDISVNTYPKQQYVDDTDALDDDGWLLFSPILSAPNEEHHPSASPLYLPSSPILHRQSQQQRAFTPAVVVTSPDALVDEPSDDYIAVATPADGAHDVTTARPSWHDMFPRRPSSAWRTGLANYKKAAECGLASAMEGSWRWGRETEEEWWDWAVEEEC